MTQITFDRLTSSAMPNKRMIARSRRDEIIGIVGGIGPLASAEFLKTIYESSLGEREQEAPKVIMYSDPTFPDRTDAMISGEYNELFEKLVLSLRGLRLLGATRTVVCCVTAHYLLKRLPLELKTGIISLVDVIFEQVMQSPQQRLLICSNGTRKTQLFQDHKHWPAMEEYIVLPEARDQDLIHYELIYQVKKNRNVHELIPALKNLLAKYRVNSFISGCTEMHVVAKRLVSTNGDRKTHNCIDPLSILAERIGVGTL